MNLEKYTDRVKGFLQSAQTFAQSAGHQKLSPEHLLKVMNDDAQGMVASLIQSAGAHLKLSPKNLKML